MVERLVAAADVDYVPAYPITPQTEIVETLARWIANGELAARLVTMDSEHSMLTAAGAAAATGARVFTATSSQGLLYAFEMLYTVAGWRVPLVLAGESWAQGKKIIVLEPRRLAARAAAERMANTLGEKVGETVGLRVRFGSKVSRATRI